MKHTAKKIVCNEFGFFLNKETSSRVTIIRNIKDDMKWIITQLECFSWKIKWIKIVKIKHNFRCFFQIKEFVFHIDTTLEVYDNDRYKYFGDNLYYNVDIFRFDKKVVTTMESLYLDRRETLNLINKVVRGKIKTHYVVNPFKTNNIVKKKEVKKDKYDPEYYRYQNSLSKMYYSTRQNLDQWFWYGQPECKMRKVYIESQRKNLIQERKIIRRNKERIGTERFLTGRVNISIVYPKSGISLLGRMKSFGNISILEPEVKDTAFWVINTKDVENQEVINLKDISHRRFNHTVGGKLVIEGIEKGIYSRLEDFY